MKYLLKILPQNKGRLLIYFDQVIISGSNFIFAIVLTRILGISSYGEYALIWMITFFFSSVQQALIIAPLYTLSEKYKNQDKIEFHTTLKQYQNVLSIITFIISTIILSIFYNTTQANLPNLITIAFAITGYIHIDFQRRMMFLQKEFIHIIILDLIYYPLSIILLFTASLFFNITLLNHFQILASLSLVCLIICHKKLEYHLNFQRLKESWSIIWEYSKYLFYTSLLQFLTGNLFLILTGTILSSSHLGAIRICQNIMGGMHILFSAFENYIPIKASKIFNQNGFDGLRKYYKKLIIDTGPIILTFNILIILFNKQLLKLLYNIDNQNTRIVLILFGIIYPFIFIGTLQRFIIRTIEQNKIIYTGYLISTIISLIICYPIVYYYGVIGATTGLLITQIIYVFYYQLMIKKTYV